MTSPLAICLSLVLTGYGLQLSRCGFAWELGVPSPAKTAMRRYGCPVCHVIPGVSGAHGLVGPSLERLSMRSYVGGVLPNTSENLVSWIKNPKNIDGKTAMPNLEVTDNDAREIAKYLQTLR